MWERFEPPKGTKKASLSEERELYELIRDTEIEARFSLMDFIWFPAYSFFGKKTKSDQTVAWKRSKRLPRTVTFLNRSSERES